MNGQAHREGARKQLTSRKGEALVVHVPVEIRGRVLQAGNEGWTNGCEARGAPPLPHLFPRRNIGPPVPLHSKEQRDVRDRVAVRKAHVALCGHAQDACLALKVVERVVPA